MNVINLSRLCYFFPSSPMIQSLLLVIKEIATLTGVGEYG